MLAAGGVWGSGCLTTPQNAGGRWDVGGPTCDIEMCRREESAMVDVVGWRAAGRPTRQMVGGITSSSDEERSERPPSLRADDQVASAASGVMVDEDGVVRGGPASAHWTRWRSSCCMMSAMVSWYDSWRRSGRRGLALRHGE